MSLFKCPECMKDVSSKAKSCPQCGFPIRAHLTKKKGMTLTNRLVSWIVQKAQNKNIWYIILFGLLIYISDYIPPDYNLPFVFFFMGYSLFCIWKLKILQMILQALLFDGIEEEQRESELWKRHLESEKQAAIERGETPESIYAELYRYKPNSKGDK